MHNFNSLEVTTLCVFVERVHYNNLFNPLRQIFMQEKCYKQPLCRNQCTSSSSLTDSDTHVELHNRKSHKCRWRFNSSSVSFFIDFCLVFSTVLRRSLELLVARRLYESRWEVRRRVDCRSLCAHTEEHSVTPRKFSSPGIRLLFAVFPWRRQSTCNRLLQVSCHCRKKSNSRFRCYRSSLW